MAYILPVLLSICELVVFTLAYQGADLPPGPYCFKNNIPNCCTGRVDNCSHPILDSICYCDEFCYRPVGHDDCCPDYLAACASYITTTSTPTTTTSPTTNAIPTTTTTTTTITTTTTAIPTARPPEKGCSNTCDYDSENEVNSGQCAEDSCIINNNVIFQVNRDESLGWRAANYSQFYDKKLKDGIIYKLGTFKVTSNMYKAGGISYDTHVVDKEFDSRIRWPDYISPVADQGWCGSDWAVSLATIASDRFGIQSNGAESVRLSAQTLLSCNYQRQKGCEGGHVDTAWNYANIYGLVEEHCFPYEGKQVQCPYKLRGNLISDGCKPMLPDRKERYTVAPLTRLGSEQAVMFDIITSGPILAVMTVYQDFFHYSGGIYRHSRYGDQKLKGYHSVRVLGWGEENGQKYWIVANSWGTEWGENGYFRIARGSNESGIESFMVSALCQVLESAL